MAKLFDLTNGSENFPIYFKDDKLKEKLQNFQYVSCNIPGPGTDTSDFEEEIQGCACAVESCDQTNTFCSCMKYGQVYSSDKKILEKLLRETDAETSVFQECNLTCKCSLNCLNRVVQHGIVFKLEVSWTEEKGFCLHTLEDIDSGRFVCEYAGQILTHVEAKRRTKLLSKYSMNYIFALKEHVASGVQTTFIDPSLFGNVGRFINHSCEPNLVIYPVRFNNLVPKVCLFAARYIHAREELTYSYGSLEDPVSSGVQETMEQSKKICKCGTHSCRGVLPFDSSIFS